MPEKITKSELIDLLSVKTSLKKSEIHTLIDGLFSEIKSALLSGYSIELRGFGTFESKRRKGKAHARNPKTGKHVVVEDHSVVIFRAGRELKTLAKSVTHREEA